MLNMFFLEVFVEKHTSFVPSLSPRSDCSPVCNIEFSTEKVFANLISLNPCKSPGPDGCHPRILKETAEQLITLLAILYQKSFDTQKFTK